MIKIINCENCTKLQKIIKIVENGWKLLKITEIKKSLKYHTKLYNIINIIKNWSLNSAGEIGWVDRVQLNMLIQQFKWKYSN